MARRSKPKSLRRLGFDNRHEFITSHRAGEGVRTEAEAAARPRIIVHEGSQGITIESTCFSLPTLTDVQAFRELLGFIEDRLARRQALEPFAGPYVVKLRTAALYGKLATPGTTARAVLKGTNGHQRRTRR
jgi:hypothetical protein